jgi:uncharacterized membrane protein YeaQ/YmgE (transglycosylase-associated protein family)
LIQGDTSMNLLYVIIIGLIAGAIAGNIRKGSGFGIFGDIVIGVIGSLVGYGLLRVFVPGANYGIVGDIIVGVIGSLIFLSIVSFFQKKA